MLKDIIKKRYSAKFFSNNLIEQEKIDYILDCALNAPSKQSLYPYQILVLHNSSAAIDFKNYLFWNDTWTNNNSRINGYKRTAKNTRFNGQYRAPLVFLYAHRIPTNLTFTPGDINTNRDVLDSIDMTVSASFAMLAAEEQGLQTCFGKCHSDEYVNTVLGTGSVRIGLALGIGYATVRNNKSMSRPVYDNKNRLQGYDTANIDQTFPIKSHNVRRNKPNIDKLYRYI